MLKKVLAILPFDSIYPPTNGGMKRCFHVIDQLATHFNLTIIINQKKDEFLQAIIEYPAIKNVAVFSTDDTTPKDAFNILPAKFQYALRYRWYKKQFKGPADGNFLKYYPVLKRLLQEDNFDIVILENIATLNAVSVITKFNKGARIIYNAHNVDSNLAKSFLEKSEISESRYLEIRNTETKLYEKVDAIFCCSETDRIEFDKLNKGKLLISVVPNGIEPCNKLYNEGVKKEVAEYILFCGILSTIPNAEGLNWFCSQVWPSVKKTFPKLKLLVVGGGSVPKKYSEFLQDESIVFSGKVKDVSEWYNRAAISIVPLLTGSGTRLKVLESMACGVPVIATAKGAEGIDYLDNYHLLEANTASDFHEKVLQLIRDKELRLSLAERSYELIKQKYDWEKIGVEMANFVNNEILKN